VKLINVNGQGIAQLNYSLDALQQRYNKAKKDNHKSFRYSLRLRIAYGCFYSKYVGYLFLLTFDISAITIQTLFEKSVWL
jgi:hypothetical protein